MLFTPVLNEAQKFVLNLFSKRQMHDLSFHNYAHTLQVVQATFEITLNLNIADEQQELILLTAWFHDTGYSITYLGHEEESQKLAAGFLREHGYPEAKMKVVLDDIRATKPSETPQNLLEEIIRDADLFHLSTTGYRSLLQKLRQEWQVYIHKMTSDDKWLQENLTFLLNHQYYTAYAQKNWEPGKKANIRQLQQEIAKLPGR